MRAWRRGDCRAMSGVVGETLDYPPIWDARHRARSTRPSRAAAAQWSLLNKPYGVLCQFSDDGSRADARRFHRRARRVSGRPARRRQRRARRAHRERRAAGAHRVAARTSSRKTYWVQVEGTPNRAQLAALRAGVDLRDGRTRPRAGARDRRAGRRCGRAIRRSACAARFRPRGSRSCSPKAATGRCGG